MRARGIFLFALMLTASCHELPEPFTIDPEFPSGGPDGQRVTYNPGEDRNPAWSSNSDSVYYGAQSFPPFPGSKGLLLASPRTGGVVTQLLPAAQPGPLQVPWLSAPAPARAGQSLAYYDIIRHRDFGCAAILGDAFPLEAAIVKTLPSIQDASLEVRTLSGTQPMVARHPINFKGVTFDSTRGPVDPGFTIVIDVHPYHQYYARVGHVFLRSSWSPDGTRVVFTDGLDLYLWTVGSANPVVIPNTRDGVWPAWSPDGQWIAFTRLSRKPRLTRMGQRCYQAGRADPIAFMDVIVYDPTFPTIERVRVDGTGGSVIGPGEAPSWASNGTELVFAREGSLWRSAADGSNARILPNTANGIESAVSPDGKWLAFAKHNSELATNDIWVVAF